MTKLIILQGLPASGKSTKAEELCRLYGNTIRLNRDLLRTMLHFDKWNPKKEGLTIKAETELTRKFLNEKINIIIDDTNFGNTIERWKTIAKECNAKFELIKVETSVEECIERDLGRRLKGERYVGDDVIKGMARRNKIAYNRKQKDIICDLDGTLCDIKHRLHYVKEEAVNGEGFNHRDWKSFFEHLSEDKPRQEVLDILEKYKDTHNIVFVSGRPDSYKEQTLQWLDNNYPFEYDLLIMRRASDHRPDDEVKEEILKDYFELDKIELVIDDRPRVIQMWRKNGLQVIDVGDGIDF